MEWTRGSFGLDPRWKMSPSTVKIEALVRKYFKVREDTTCRVTFFAQGAFNKLYKVSTDAICAVIRVALPVDPRNKTNSEAATVEFVHQNTCMPVPRIIAFDDSCQNELGFEWILMEMLPGETLRMKWRKLFMDAKQVLVKQLAKYQAQLFCYRFPVIGNIYVDPDVEVIPEWYKGTIALNTRRTQQTRNQALPILGQMVSMIFFWGDHITQDVPRGPFTSSEEWIRARLTIVLTNQERIILTSGDEDDVEEAQDAKVIAKRLLVLMPSIFPTEEGTSESFVLFHDDLSMQNILVDDHGKISGVVDWECVSALPLWRTCQLPEFLKGRDRNNEPKRSQYIDDTDNTGTGSTGEPRDNLLDNEGVNSLYWEHLLEYELTILRRIYMKEMGNIVPEWIEEMEKSTVKADFDEAVQNCDNSWCTKKIMTWLDALEKGENYDLRKGLLE